MGREARWRGGFGACAGVVLIALGAAQLAGARTDLGTVGGLTYIFGESSAVAAGNGEDGIAECPSGEHVVGGGAQVGGNAAESFFNTSYPFDGSDANSTPDDGWGSHFWNLSGVTKSVDVIAVCRKGSFKYRSGSHKVKAGHGQAVAVKCPAGTHVSGGGVYADGSIADALVNSSYPYNGPDPGDVPDDGWKGREYNLAGSARQMTVFAICGAKKLDYERDGPVTINATSGVGSHVACPNSRHLTGGGLRLNGAPAGEAHPVTMLPSDLSDADSIPDDRLLAVAGIENSSTPASMVMYAICK